MSASMLRAIQRHRSANNESAADDFGESSPQTLLQSFAMIILSESGDKTPLISAILAMRHPRLVVFAGAFGSLVVMSILSAAMGHLLHTLIPRRWTQIAASILFLSFGAKMLLEARQMKGGNEKIQEMREAEEDIEDDDSVHHSATLHEHDIPLDEMESGGHVANQTDLQRNQSVRPSSKVSWIADGARNFCSLFLGPNVYLVALGTVIGHGCWKYLSTKISVKHVTFGGSVLFLLFGVIYLYEAFAISRDVGMSIPILVSPEAEPRT
ncbi:UPF0016-domain-containing protein [Phlegmacium glaucopus]|nr:UPF0016-domain-containing protein [Phlegmacium glaucopus]